MANVLILGAGYVGTEVYSFLRKDNKKVFIRSRKELDYANQGTLRKFLGNNDIDYVINCAGFTGRPNVDEAELKKKECWELNVELPLAVQKSCDSFGANYIHISSGCIYSGYDKEWTEEDEPNFGMFGDSSFYSKSKHAYERLSKIGCTIRLRMPISDDFSPRNFITKIHNYDYLINFRNSKTYLPDLAYFLEHVISNNRSVNNIGPLNFVNTHAQDTKYLTERMKAYGLGNDNWKFVDIKDINIIAPRSNCVLSTAKLHHLFPDFHMQSEAEAIESALTNIQVK